MPVGTPKVPFYISEEEDPEWTDLYHVLFHKRMLFLGQEITDEVSNQVAGMMICLSIENRRKQLYLFINSPGGGLAAGIAIYDTIQSVKPEVQTMCIGIAASLASLILVGGTPTKRIAVPSSKVMMHQPRMSLYEQKAVDCSLESSQLLRMQIYVQSVYEKKTDLSLRMIEEYMDRDSFFSAEEALAYGIVDTIAEEGSGLGLPTREQEEAEAKAAAEAEANGIVDTISDADDYLPF